jgi:hypothetical protein
MSKKVVDELMALADALDRDLGNLYVENERMFAATYLREYASLLDQEPVAWHVCSVNSDGSLSLEFAAPWEEFAHEHINDAINEHDIDGATSWVVRPVYTHPPAPQREPLTQDQIMEYVREAGLDWHRGWVMGEPPVNRYEEFARAVLAAAQEQKP